MMIKVVRTGVSAHCSRSADFSRLSLLLFASGRPGFQVTQSRLKSALRSFGGNGGDSVPGAHRAHRLEIDWKLIAKERPIAYTRPSQVAVDLRSLLVCKVAPLP